MISASLVKELREATGAGMLDCKKALEATNGSIDEAINWLREKGISKAAKKADRILNAIITNDVKTNEDVLKLDVNGETIEQIIINKTSKIGEKLSFRRFEKLTKTDNQVFGSYLHMGGKIAVLVTLSNTTEEVAKDVAMHAAAMRPSVVRRDQLSKEEVEKEREILKEQAMNEGKPADIAEKMVEGRLLKFYQESCLEEQAFVKDDSINVLTYVKNNGGTIDNMVRFEVGEGMAKREENFAEEVAKQMGE